jgi:hypothetical protein
MNNLTKGITNWLSKRHESINENLTGCWQRYVVLGYERKGKYLIPNTNSTVLSILFRESNSDFHHRTGETCRTKWTCPDRTGGSTFCPRNIVSFQSSDVCWSQPEYYEYDMYENDESVSDSLIAVEDMSDQASKTIHGS